MFIGGRLRMGNRHLNLFYPQWQGGGYELLGGAMELKECYLGDHDFIEIEVLDEDSCPIENGIIGYCSIVNQLKAAWSVIIREEPDTIFTVGGGCDAETPTVSYLNHKLKGDLAVIWFDAHGDLNTPESSVSKKFHGMPLRALLGDGDAQIIKGVHTPLACSQLIMVGQRSLDEPEQQYIRDNSIEVFTVEKIQESIEPLIDAIGRISRNVYVHIDLDVLDTSEFPFVMVPEPNGLKTQTLSAALKKINGNFNIKGMSLLECMASGKSSSKLLKEIVELGIALESK